MNSSTKIIMAAIAVAVVAFFFTPYSPINLKTFFSNSVIKKAPPATAAEAWSIFEQYVEAARNKNLELVADLSYQLSPACQQGLTPECEQAMGSLVGFHSVLATENFENIEADSKQAVIWSDYGADNAKYLIYFVSKDGELKALGARVCDGGSTDEPVECQTNKNNLRTDTNKDGWWDEVEKLFIN